MFCGTNGWYRGFTVTVESYQVIRAACGCGSSDFGLRALGLQRSEKCDESGLVLRGELQSEFVTLYGPRLRIKGWPIIFTEAQGVKPVFQRRHAAIVFKGTSIPDSSQCRDLVVAGSASCFHCQAWICTDNDCKDVVLRAVLRRYVKASGRRQFVVRVQRGSMALATAFALEDLLPVLGEGVKRIWIRWRPERYHVFDECVELFIAIPSQLARVRTRTG